MRGDGRWEEKKGGREGGGDEGRWGRRGEEGCYSVKNYALPFGRDTFLFSTICLLSPCVQRERQKDREKLRKKKESDLPGAVMQMNKYATNEAFSNRVACSL